MENQEKVNESEVLKKLDSIANIVHQAQEVASRNNANISENQEQIKKMSTDISGIIEENQKLKQQQKGLEEYSKVIERALSRMQDNKGSSEGLSETDIKMKTEFNRYLRKGERLSPEVVEGICAEITRKTYLSATESELELHKKTLVEGVDPNAGYLVRPQLMANMIKRFFETEPMRSLATVVTTATNAVEFIVDDNEIVDGGWVGEVDARPTTNTPQIATLTIYAHELYANPPATQTLLDDAGFDVEAWLSNKVVDRITRAENAAFVTGSGTKKPRGFTTYPTWTTPSAKGVNGVYERGKLDIIKSGVNGAFGADDVKTVQNSLLEQYQGNASWFMQRKTFDFVITLKDGMGRYLLNPDSIQARDGKILLGAPVVFANDMPAVATNALAIAYADFKNGYTIVDKLGFRVIRDIYTSKPNILFYTTKRTGGDVTNYQCIKLLQLSA